MKHKIFCVGMSRTGTTTITNTLQLLGYNIIHYPHNIRQMHQLDVDGGSDIPIIPHYKRLSFYHPQSKFILTLRDKQQWLESFERYLKRKDEWSGWSDPNNVQLQLRKQVYGAFKFDKQLYGDAFDKHYADVRSFFAKDPDRLLELDIVGGTDSPAKLAKFLGHPEHSLPSTFPVTNEVK